MLPRLVALLLVLTSIPAFAQLPPVRHVPLTDRDKRSLELADELIEKANPELFKSSYDNHNRVHVKFNFTTQRSASLVINVPISWGEERAVNLVALLAKEQGWQITDRVVTTEGGTIFANALAPSACRSEGELTAIDVDWPRALAALRQAGVEKAEIRVRTRRSSTLKAEPCGIPWTHVDHVDGQILAALVSTDAPVRPMRVRFGHTLTDGRNAYLMMIGIIIAPFLIMLVLRAWAMKRVGDASIYQIYARTRLWVLLGGFLAWEAVLTSPAAFNNTLARLSGMPAPVRVLCFLFLLLGVPALVAPLLALISMPVDRAFRGIEHTRRQYVLRSLIPISAIATFVIVTFLARMWAPEATTRLLTGEHGRGGLLGTPLIPGIIATVIIGFGARLSFIKRMNPKTLESGDLLNGILGLCRKAGVNISHVYIGQTEKDKMANAFVTSSGTVILTDYLVKRFTRDEVDGVVAHELGHLRLNHMAKRRNAQALSLGIWGVFAFAVWILKPSGWWPQIVYWSFWIVPTLLSHRLSRRHELEADAEAVRLTEKPEVFISMLTKLAALNTQPLRPGRLTEASATHPGTARRIEAIAKLYEIDAQRVESLMAQANADLARPQPPQSTAPSDVLPSGYIVPSQGIAEDLLFNPKTRLAKQMPGIYFGFIPGFLIMCLAFPLIDLVSPSGTGAAAAVAGLTPFAAGFMYIFAVIKIVGFTSMRSFYGPLRKKIEERYGICVADGTYVGFAPGAEVRSYEGETSWDIGFLTWESGMLRYTGERCSFSVRPDQAERVEIRSHKSLLAGSFPRIYVTWRRDADSDPEAFNMECRNAGSMAEYRRLTSELYDQIQSWQQQSHSPVVTDTTYHPAVSGLPPRPDTVLSAPVPPLTNAGMGMVLLAMAISVAIPATALYIGIKVAGKEQFTSEPVRWGFIFVSFLLFRHVLTWLKSRSKGDGLKAKEASGT